jgi:hypothetical protein
MTDDGNSQTGKAFMSQKETIRIQGKGTVRGPIDQMGFVQIAARITAIMGDQTLADESNFVAREQARQELAEQIIVPLDTLIDGADKGLRKKLRTLRRQAAAAVNSLDLVHEQFFATMRQQIRYGHWPKMAWMELFACYEEQYEREVWDDPPHYDQLDTLLDGVLQIDAPPRMQRQPQPEMVLYQPTPARIILELIRRLQPSHDDVFYDLGSGLGRVAMMMGLVSNAQVRGVEYEPSYVEFAQYRADELNQPQIKFICGDARSVSYADGTIFYLYTPFKGTILQDVLNSLREEARYRRIRVCTYGPGTLEVLDQEWLESIDSRQVDMHRPVIYRSR